MLTKQKSLSSLIQMIRRRSKKRAAQEREYSKLRAKFLESNPLCARCQRMATQVHHMKGRTESLLTDVRLFVAMCHDCHEWVEHHPVAAKELGYSLSRHQTETI